MTTSAIDRLRGLAEQSGKITATNERLVASELRVPVAAVHGAATFFDDLAPTRRGRRHVRVCGGTSCFVVDRGRHINEQECRRQR
jgi:NADH:ubiquinone oxidoreductase subunit E